MGLIDDALRSFLQYHRSGELDAEYPAYDAHSVDVRDECGNRPRSGTRPHRADGGKHPGRRVGDS